MLYFKTLINVSFEMISEKEANKCYNGLSRSLQPLPVLNCVTISQQVENIHKQFNSKISGMNEELCALQLVRLKTIKYRWK